MLILGAVGFLPLADGGRGSVRDPCCQTDLEISPEFHGSFRIDDLINMLMRLKSSIPSRYWIDWTEWSWKRSTGADQNGGRVGRNEDFFVLFVSSSFSSSSSSSSSSVKY